MGRGGDHEEVEPGREIAKTGLETSGAVAGALVGLALGGPGGAIVGAGASPLIVRAGEVILDVATRRRQRAAAIVERGIDMASGGAEEALTRLENDPEAADALVELIDIASRTDQLLEGAFASLIADVLANPSVVERDRLMMVADSLRGLRGVHVRILLAIDAAGGTLTADGIAAALDVPAVELRGAVRELELRGMIKEPGTHPVQWSLRSLGKGVVSFVHRSN